MKNALLSVYDKTGIVEFARGLVELGWSLYASGGTAKVLGAAGLTVTDVATLSGLPPILGHRVVTLVPQIHAGLLAREDQRQELEALGWPWFDLVAVDLYPLQDAVNKPDATEVSVIELTDIGGPTLLRSAAKGRRIVIADPNDRQLVLDWLETGEPESKMIRRDLAAKAEAIVAEYCLISAWFHSQSHFDGFVIETEAICKYGENAWQAPAQLKMAVTNDPLALNQFHLIEGSAPSYNNWADLDRLLQTMTHIATALEANWLPIPRIAIGVKHGNPCGVGVAKTPEAAITQMLEGDPLAIFGGLVMTNFPLTTEHAVLLRLHGMSGTAKRLLDGVIAPGFFEGAVAELGRKGGKCRMLGNPALEKLGYWALDQSPRYRFVRGGFLVQPNFTYVLNLDDPELECVGSRNAAVELDLLLAWAIGSTSNSNTVTLVKNGMLLGNGVGQQDRVGSATLAVARAHRSGHDVSGAVAYSDSFFPFPDGLQVLISAGIKAVLATKGSVNDDLVRSLALEKGISLYLLPDVAARGFFGH